MASLHLKEPPFPLGDTEDDIKKDPKLCRTCWNLYGGSVITAVGLPGISMHENSGSINADRAAKLGNMDPAPTWAGPGRSDYTSWQINVYVLDMSDSVAAGCASCILLKEALAKLTQGKLDFSDPELWLEIIFCKGNVLRVNLVRGDPPDDFDIFSSGFSENWNIIEAYELYTLPGHPCPWPTIGTSMSLEKPDWSLLTELGGSVGHIEPDPNSEASFDMIKDWIKSCKEGHAVCSDAVSATTRGLPKRVIDIGPESNDGIHVFEHDDSTNRIDKPYIALSHCWGTTRHMISTTSTLDQWKHNIPFASLAKTFQDSITISRKLGIQYVWIDSLCIIQDDRKDWEIEAAKMASIYHGAELVLAATGSADGAGGCLFQREPFITVSGSFPDGKPFQVHGRRKVEHGVFGWNTDTNASKGSSNPISGTIIGDVQDHPLMTRAWCFQERLLATRILHYTKNEIVFDCLSSMECECGALEKHDKDSLIHPRRIIKTGHKYVTETKSYKSSWSRPFTPLEGEAKERAEHHELWRDLIIQYSQKQITHRTDGLPAIAGLATKWSNKLTGNYLAGLWERDLLNHLRWMPDEKDSGQEPQYIAPSWSWLSVHRGVTWGLHSFEMDEFFITVDYSRTRCVPSGINPFGEIASGHIFLKGRIMPTRFSIQDDLVRLEKKGHDTRIQFARPDSLAHLRKLRNQELFCLRFCTRPQTTNAYDDDSALVLVKADAESLRRQSSEVQSFKHVYQRVGFIRNYTTKAWSHEQDSTEVELYLI